MFVEQSLPVGPLQLNVMRGPANGPPLVLFHGVIRCWQTFQPILPALATRWQLWGLDFPGHGKSERSGGEYLVAEYVASATEFVHEQFREPMVIYGHSLGAMVAAGVAGALGERVLAAVLEDPPFDTMGQRIRETSLADYFRQLQPFASDRRRPIAAMAKELAEITTTDPKSGKTTRLGDVRDAAALRFLAHCLQQLDPAVLKPIVAQRWLEGYDWQAAISNSTCPLLLLQGDELVGGMLTDADATQAVVNARDATRLKFAGAGHNLHMVRTQEVLNAVTAFLEPIL